MKMGRGTVGRGVSVSLVTVGMLQGTTALARFDLPDQNKIDSEIMLTEETMADMTSYRPRPSWRETWDNGANGVWMSAGSITLERFAYDEDIRLMSSLDDALTVGVREKRNQNSAEDRRDQEMRMQYNWREGPTPRVVHVGFLGDYDTWKANGDLGVALGFHNTEGSTAEAYAWSIDHFFNAKGGKQAMYEDRARAYGVRGVERALPAGASLMWNVLWEPRLRLENSVTQLRYMRAANDWTWTLRVPLSEGWLARWDARHEGKLEVRETMADASEDAHKSMRRQTHWDDFSLVNPATDTEVGFAHSLRLANYSQEGWTDREATPYEIDESSIRRQEVILYGFWDYYRQERGHRLRLGLITSIGQAATPGDDGRGYNQSKIQTRWIDVPSYSKGLDGAIRQSKVHTGWEYKMDKASLVGSLSWDLDVALRNCTSGRTCRLYDGGNLQVQITL